MRIAVHLFSFFLLIFLFIIGIIPPIKPFIIYICIFLISLLTIYYLLLAIVRILLVLIKNLYQIVVSQKSDNNFINLTSLGAVSFFYVATGNSFIYTFFNFTVNFINELINKLSDGGNSLNNYCDLNSLNRLSIREIIEYGYSAIDSYFPLIYIDYLSNFFNSDCFNNLFLEVIYIWHSTFIESYNVAEIYNLPFLDIVSFTFFWLIITRLLEFLFTNKFYFEKIIEFSKNSDFLKEPTRTNTISNIIFFMILGTGLYLSIATIAAIPTLQDTSQIPQRLTSENFQKLIFDSLETFKNEVPKTKDSNPLYNKSQVNPLNIIQSNIKDKLEDINANYDTNIQKIEDEYNNTDEFGKDRDFRTYTTQLEKTEKTNFENNKKNNIQQINQALYKLLTQRNDLINNVIKISSNSHIEIQKRANEAITQYLYSTTVRKGSRETQEHFLALINWFEIVKNQTKTQIFTCENYINNLDDKLENISEGNIDSIIKYSLQEDQYIFNEQVDSLIKPVEELLNIAYEDCNLLNTQSIPEIPYRSNLGNYLGFFSIVASWLLQTESLPLTLITGLLGFGLLGSACSSFIREYITLEIKKENQAETKSPLVKNLSKVIIIGLSAAILVFLSVMGGLAVFFSNNTNPNPYALLLGCLIAAVFGEDIWRTARRRLEENLEKINKEKVKEKEEKEKEKKE